MPSSNVRYQFSGERKKLRRAMRKQHDRCQMCGRYLDWEHPYLPNSAELDEIVPISRLPQEVRGRAAVDPRNIQVLCRACNKAKSNHLGWVPPKEPKRVRTDGVNDLVGW